MKLATFLFGLVFCLVFNLSILVAQEMKMPAKDLEKFAVEVLRRSNNPRDIANVKKLRELLGEQSWNFRRGSRAARGRLSVVGKYHGLIKNEDGWIVSIEPQLPTMPMVEVPLKEFSEYSAGSIKQIQKLGTQLGKILKTVNKGEIERERVEITRPFKTTWKSRRYQLQKGEVYAVSRPRDNQTLFILVDGNEIPVPKVNLRNYSEDEKQGAGYRPMDEFDSGTQYDPETGSDGYGSRDLMRDLLNEGVDRLAGKDKRQDGRGGLGGGYNTTPIESPDSPLKLEVVWVPHQTGLLVQEVYRNGLGEKIGIKKGDLIYTLNSERLNNSRKFFAIRDRDRKISLKIKRKNVFDDNGVETRVLPTIRLVNGRAVIDGYEDDPFNPASVDNSDVPNSVLARFYGSWEFNSNGSSGTMKFEKFNPGIARDALFFRPLKVRLTDEFGDVVENSAGKWDIPKYETRTGSDGAIATQREIIHLSLDLGSQGLATYTAKFNKDRSKIKLELKSGSGLRELILQRR